MEKSNTELLPKMREAYRAGNTDMGNELAREVLARLDMKNWLECADIVTVFHEAADKQQYEIAVDEIVRAGWDFDRPFPDGKTLLHYAVDKALAHCRMRKTEDRELFARIAGTGASFQAQDKTGCNAIAYFMTACYRERGETAPNCILDIAGYMKREAFYQKDENGMTPLHYALLTDHKQVLETAAKKGCDFNVQTDRGETLLHMAMAAGDISTAAFLLKNGASPDITDHRGRNALHFLLLKPEFARPFILRKEHWKNSEQGDSFAELEREVLRTFEKAPLLNGRDRDGHPPFYYFGKEEECVLGDWFLKNGAYESMDSSEREEFERKMEDAAQEYDTYGVHMYMKMRLAERSGRGKTPAHSFEFWGKSALEAGNRKYKYRESLFCESGYYLERMLQSIPDIRFEDEKVFEIIRVAFNEKIGHTEILFRLCDMGVDLNRLQDDEGVPLLWKIVQEEYGWDMVSPALYLPVLEKCQLDICGHDDREQGIFWRFLRKYAWELDEKVTVLGNTSEKEEIHLAQLLKYFPAEEFTVRDVEGKMISLVAAGARKPELMRALIQKGMDVNVSGEGKYAGITPLHIACYRSYPQMVEMIMAAGGDAQAVDREGHSAAQYAAFSLYNPAEHTWQRASNRDDFMHYDRQNHNWDSRALWEDRMKIWEMLSEIDMPDNSGVTPLMELSKSDKGVELCLDYFIGRGADINRADNNGDTPMMMYIRYSRYDTSLPLYISAGADVNRQNNEGNTPLIMALERNRFRFAKYLIAAGADANCKNNQGISAMDYAIRHEMTNYIRLMEQ